MSDLYAHYRQQIRETDITADLDKIIASAYSSYMKDGLTYEEYGKIYFAAIRKINRLSSPLGTK